MKRALIDECYLEIGHGMISHYNNKGPSEVIWFCLMSIVKSRARVFWNAKVSNASLNFALQF